MQKNISKQRLKKKVLDRWENEGGKVLADQTGIIKSRAPDSRAGTDNAAQARKPDAAKKSEGTR